MKKLTLTVFVLFEQMLMSVKALSSFSKFCYLNDISMGNAMCNASSSVLIIF